MTEENSDFELAIGLFHYNETSETSFSGLEFICLQNSFTSPQLSRIQHINSTLPLDGSCIKDTIVKGFNRKEQIRIGRCFQAFISSQLDTFSNVKEQKLPVLFSLLVSVGQYTITKSNTSIRIRQGSRFADLNTFTITMFLQCTQCSMHISLQELSRISLISNFKPTTHTAELLNKLSLQHDAQCCSRLAIHRLRSEEVHHSIEEGKLDSFINSIGIY